MRFEIEPLSARPEDLTQAQFVDYVVRQLQNISHSISALSEGEKEVTTSAPPRNREGMLRYADGSVWNPAGVGKGPVVFDGSNWLPLYSTPAALLAALLTVDGPGSLLNADFLDNQSGAYYQDASNLNAGTVPAGRMPALTGDVTSTVGTVAITIANNAVTLAKMAQLATMRVLGRTTAGTGDVEALTLDVAGTAFTVAYRDVLGDLYGTHMGAGDGSGSQPGFFFNSDNNTGLRRVTTDSAALVAGATDIATFNANGFGAGLAPSSRNNCSLHTVNGLGFPATQVASTDANVLDDYEEGTWTATVTAGSGTFTTVSGSGRYTKVGNRFLFHVLVTITTNGTAGTNVVATLPFTCNDYAVAAGREDASTGKMLQGILFPSGANITIYNYDNTYPGASGYVLRVSGQVEL